MSAGILGVLASFGAGAGGGGSPDPSVLRVIGDNGTSTTFIDRSPSTRTLTTFGSAINSTTVVGSGAHSISLPSSGSYITAPDSTDWNTDGVVTWEALFYIDVASYPGANTFYTLMSQSSAGSARHFFVVITDSTSLATAYFLDQNAAGTQILNSTSSTIAPRTATHVAAVLNGAGNSFNIFINGVRSSSAVQLASPTDCTSPLYIGAYTENGSHFAGRDFVGNLKVRITPSALYSGVTYTAPTDF